MASPRASPRLLAICQPVARGLEQRDGVALLRLLTPFADDAGLEDAIAAVAAAFPHLRRRPVPPVWPVSREERCCAVLAASVARPRDDTALANAAVRPTSWNWLTSLSDVLAGRDHPEIGDLNRALEAMQLDRAAILLNTWPQAAAKHGWQALLLTASLAGLNPHPAVDHALQEVLADLARDDINAPAPVVAVVLAHLAQRRAVPDNRLCAHAVALPAGLSRDLATAAALTAWSEAGPLAADAIERLAMDRATSRMTARASPSGAVWLDVLQRLLSAQAAPWADLFGGKQSGSAQQEPNQNVTVRDAQALAKQAAAASMPVTARMASLLLTRLRHGDNSGGASQSVGTSTAHLAAMIIPAPVLRTVETPLAAAERIARLLAVADATVMGRPVDLTATPLRQVSSKQITVVIVNFNQAQTTLRLLRSLVRCWFDFAGEVVLIDNGSDSDDFAALTAGLMGVWPGRVRLLRSEVNLGPGGARNILFNAARTPWVLSLDNDMIVTGDIGRHLLPVVNASHASFFNLAYEELDQPGVAGVGKSWSIVDDGSGGRMYRTEFAAWAATAADQAPKLLVSNRISGTAALQEVAAFHAVGGFSKLTALCYEDYEMSFRIADKSYEIENLSVPLLVHGHLAPSRLADIAAVSGRFDRDGIAASTAAFAGIVATRFAAHLGERAGSRAPPRVIQRRFDLRHADGPAFFKPLKAGVKTVSVLRHEAWADTAALVTQWLAARAVNVELRDESEFAEIEQALLVLQACDIIVVGASMLKVSVDRCHQLGLVWSVGTTCPHVLVMDTSRTERDRSSLYERGPSVAVMAQANEIIAAIAARL